MAAMDRYISCISVERSSLCDYCNCYMVQRDIVIYDKDMKFICNTGDYAEEGIPEKTCPDCEQPSLDGYSMSEKILASNKIAAIANGIDSDLYDDQYTHLCGSSKRCASCNEKIIVVFYPTKELLNNDELVFKGQIKEHFFKADLTICAHCYANVKPAKC